MLNEQNNAGFQEKARSFLKQYGFFVVAGLCALCAGIAALVTFLPAEEEPNSLEPAPTPIVNAGLESLPNATIEPPDAPVAQPETTPVNADRSGATPAPAPTAAPASAIRQQETSKAPAPVDGVILFGYAADTLLYSETLDQWTTHEGVDIAGRLGMPVKAIKSGTVERVYTDDALGVCVEVTHADGLTSIYGNLEENPPVGKGDRLIEGDTVGLIGDTAISECALEPHVHFALKQNGVFVDPHDYTLLAS